jgi:hypothetical protein
MVQLDLKKLSKGMSVKDKMRLLFQDMNRQAETAGKESVLTPQERKAIVDDARNTGEIIQIRKVNELYLAAMFISIDMEITQLQLLLSMGQLEKTLTGIILKGATEEIIGEMVYDLASQDENTPTELENKIKELRIKYKVDNILFKGFDFFNPIEDNEGASLTEFDTNVLVPNQNIQKSFINSFYLAKKLKRKLYEMSYVLGKTPIDFLLSSTKDLIKDSEELLIYFTNLNETFKPLRIYRDFGQEFSKNTNLVEPKFFEIIQDIEKNLELSIEDKEKLESSIDKSLNEDL